MENFVIINDDTVKIGKFLISSCGENSVFISIFKDGEGSEFEIDKLEKVIQEFYNEYF